MDYNLSEKHAALRAKMRAFVEQEIPWDYVREFEARDQYPQDLISKMAEWGFLRSAIPERYGGTGGNVVDDMIMQEELSTRLPVAAWAMGNVVLYGNEMMSLNGSEEQRARYFPKLAKGELKFCFALTEPNAGSDAANIKTSAVFKDGYYVINGAKMFITGSSVSNYTITFARTAESRYGGITAFIVDTKSPGYSTTPVSKLGYHGSDTCAVYYDDVKVAPEDILGGPEALHKGWQQEMKLLNHERLVLAACGLGIGRGALDEALDYAKSNFDRSVFRADLQGIQHELADMATELEAARQLAYYAAWMETEQLECIRETSMAKYFSTETAKRIARRGMNIMGQHGALTESNMQRYMRDVLVLTVGGGTSQIQQIVIGKTLGI